MVTSLRQIYGVSALTVRRALRSRLLPATAVGLLVCAVVIPMAIKGDGTAPGQVRIALNYTLGAMGLLLGITTLWSTCGAISRDIEERQFRLAAVKPIPKWRIWLGGWLAWLAINAGLLMLCGITILGVVHVKTRDGVLGDDDRHDLATTVLVGRRRISPSAENLDARVDAVLDRLHTTGEIPEDVCDADARAAVRQRLMTSRSVVPAGMMRTWALSMPKGYAADDAIALNLQARVLGRGVEPPAGTWTIAVPGRGVTHDIPMDPPRQRDMLIPLPEALLQAGDDVRITFTNTGTEGARALVLAPEDPVSLLVSESSFGGNLWRALVVVLCQLALLAALGLTAGALFSFPVAAFVVIASLLAALCSHYFVFASAPEQAVEHHHGHSHGETETPSLADRAGEALLRGVQTIVSPVTGRSPLGLLAGGLLISWALLARTVFVFIVLYSGALGLVGALVLSRREIAGLH